MCVFPVSQNSPKACASPQLCCLCSSLTFNLLLTLCLSRLISAETSLQGLSLLVSMRSGKCGTLTVHSLTSSCLNFRTMGQCPSGQHRMVPVTLVGRTGTLAGSLARVSGFISSVLRLELTSCTVHLLRTVMCNSKGCDNSSRPCPCHSGDAILEINMVID